MLTPELIIQYKKILAGLVLALNALSVQVANLDAPVLGGAKVDPITSKDTLTQFINEKDSTLPDAGKVRAIMSRDKPEIRLEKWNGEAGLTISYNGTDFGLLGGGLDSPFSVADRNQTDPKKVEWKSTKEELHAYPLEAGEGMEDGGFEIEVVLNEKPATNVFNFEISGAEDLDFFYQPALTQEEIAEGASRPENVVGSYAVYHKTKANHRIGSTNYATGKAYHIYRPKAFDTNGDWVWGELNYENGVLSVTVPQKFLDDAVYPVRVDPTIGFTGVGGTMSEATVSNRLSVSGFSITTDGSGGAVSDISAYAANRDDPSTPDLTIQAAIYKASDSSLLSPQSGMQTISAGDVTGAWRIISFSGPTLSASTGYYPAFHFGSGGVRPGHRIWYDAGSSGDSYNQTVTAWPDPATLTASTFKRSIYATYTASGGATPTPRRRVIIITED